MAGPENPFARFAPQQPEANPFSRFAPMSREQELMRLPMAERIARVRAEGVPEARMARQQQIDAPVAEDIASARRQSLIAAEPVFARTAVAAQGIPLAGEWVDEAIGAIISPEAGQRVRAMQSAMAQERPWETLGLQLGTGIISSLPLALTGAGMVTPQFASRGGNIARGALYGLGAGAVEGAVAGAGAANDGDRIGGAQEGGFYGGIGGAVFGAASPVATSLVSSGYRALRSMFGRSDVGTIARELGISRGAASVVRDALEGDDFAAAQARLQQSSSRAAVGDATEATRALLDAAAASGPRAARIARDNVQARAQQAGVEFVDVLDQALGIPVGARTAQAGIRGAGVLGRGQAYETAYATPIDYSSPLGMALEEMWSRVREPIRNRAAALMQEAGVTPSLQRLGRILPDGRREVVVLPDVRTWDFVTRALNDAAQSGETRGVMGGMTTASRSASNLSREIRTMLRRVVPEYNQALRTAASDIRRIEAVEAGAAILRTGTTREQARELMRGMTRMERDAARQGLRSYIDDLMAQTRRTIGEVMSGQAGTPEAQENALREALAAWGDLSSRRARENIRFVMGPGTDADALFGEIDRLARDFASRAAVARATQTAIRTATRESVEEAARPPFLDILGESGSVAAVGRGLMSAILGGSADAQRQRARSMFGEIATSLSQPRGAQEASRIMGRIGQAIEGQPAREQAISRFGRTGAGLLGLTGYGAYTNYPQ